MSRSKTLATTDARPVLRKSRRVLKQRVILRETTVEQIAYEGRPCVRVSLNGCHGAGKFMLLDPADWLNVERLFGQVWVLIAMDRMGRSNSYRIATARKEATSKVDPAFLVHGILTLSRWLLGVTQRDVWVRYRNGNATDLRRSNLYTYSINGAPLAASSPAAEVQEQGDLFPFHATNLHHCPACHQALPAH